MVGEEQVQRFPLLRIPARPRGVSSLTGKGDGGLALLTRPGSGGAASASAARAPGLPPETPPGAQSRTGRAAGGQLERKRGESGDLQGSLTGGREAAPGCRGRSTSPFPGLYPHTRCLTGYLSSCLSVHCSPPPPPTPPSHHELWASAGLPWCCEALRSQQTPVSGCGVGGGRFRPGSRWVEG